MLSRLFRASPTAKVLRVATGAVAMCVAIANLAGTKEPKVEWKITPEQRTRIENLHGTNFKHFFVACPLNEDNTFVVGPALDAHIQRHEDLDAHYPFTKSQHARVLELGTQAGTMGFITKLVQNAPIKRSEADMDAYIEAHAPIAAEIEQQWIDGSRVRSLWWMYKHQASDDVVTYDCPSGEDGVAKRTAEQDAAYEADFPGATAKREEIRRLGKEAEKRVEETIKAWACEPRA